MTNCPHFPCGGEGSQDVALSLLKPGVSHASRVSWATHSAPFVTQHHWVTGNACPSIADTFYYLKKYLYFIIKLENLEILEENKGETKSHT